MGVDDLILGYNETTKELKTMKIEYKVTWGGTWSQQSRTFTNLEDAIKWAKMERGMGEKVKVEKLEITEIEF